MVWCSDFQLKWGSIVLLAIYVASASAIESVRQRPLTLDMPTSQSGAVVLRGKSDGMPAWRDANDYYYYHGRRVRLLRSASEYAVQFGPGVSPQASESLIQSVRVRSGIWMKS